MDAQTDTHLVVVDGPNLVNDVGRFFTAEARSSAAAAVQAKYFNEWFDVDRLVQATLHVWGTSVHPWRDLGIVIFRSRKTVGNGAYRLADTDAFWARQGSNPVSSVLLVDLPAASGEEKGVDTSITVYLLETQQSWAAAILFTNDTDFVPVVWSLRRRGKRMLCSSHTQDRITPLVQACQHFLPWNTAFLIADRALFELLQRGGPIDALLTSVDFAGIGAYLVASEGGGLTIYARPGGMTAHHEQLLATAITNHSSSFGVSGASIHSGALPIHTIMQGLLRHRELFESAAWYKTAVFNNT